MLGNMVTGLKGCRDADGVKAGVELIVGSHQGP